VQSDLSERPTSAAQGAEARSIRDVFRLAGDVLELLHRHGVPPDPVSYAVFFAYAARTNRALADAVAYKISNGAAFSAYEVNELYAAYLKEDEAAAKRQNIGLEFEYSLAAVSGLIGEGVRNNGAFRETLETLGQRIPAAQSVQDIEVIVSKLVVENQKMSQTMQALDEGLAESHAQIERLNREMEELQFLSLRDPLTEVSNRRAFDVALAKMIEQSQATGVPFCLAMADIDHFKRINDTLGHQAGDTVLKIFASILRSNISSDDMVARCGGEEFAIILCGQRLTMAHNLLVRMLHEVRAEAFLSPEDHGVIGPVTASFGVSEFRRGVTPSGLIEQADAQLYRAKRAGRSCVRSQLIS
jgi:diguanylate cyclase